ncbi:MAG TPA: N-formylglutamate amidohydrolase [Defluviicoccus sp.]|nr:N-formylglutamate amidohydrolase [Defluviicoccus sp.]
MFSSAHSGRKYLPEFIDSVQLDLMTLRRSEDAFVDEIFAAVPHSGASFLKAHFPRVYVDPNREAFELDPAMFVQPLPAYVNTTSLRVRAGLGTVPRVVASGDAIYASKLDFPLIVQRLEQNYFPFHSALDVLLRQAHARYGCYLLIDCHSMPSVAGICDADAGLRRADFVLGDRFGTSCAPLLTQLVESFLTALGYSVRRNIPYAGGYITSHYGRPAEGRHTLQIEINRALYMDEETITPHAGLARLHEQMTQLTQLLVERGPDAIRTR